MGRDVDALANSAIATLKVANSVGVEGLVPPSNDAVFFLALDPHSIRHLYH